MKLTREMMVGCYEYLRATPPFNRWKLPEASACDLIRFTINREKQRYGYCQKKGSLFVISLSEATVRSGLVLVETMAHEMVHLYLQDKDARAQHGPRFKKAAEAVCKHHGFNPLSF